MDENSSIGFWKIAVAILLVAILIGVVFLIAREGKSVTNEKLEGISNAFAEYQDENYTMYGGMEVSGAEVRSLIERVIDNGDAICIRVFTKADTAGKDYIKKGDPEVAADSKVFTGLKEDGVRALTENKTEAAYINPSAVFTCKVCRNTNGALIGLVFEQK